MSYRHRESGKTFSEEAMQKLALLKGFVPSDYEKIDEDDIDKSEIEEDQLLKSVEALESIVASGDRKGLLLKKAQNGDLDDGEREELYGLLGGGSDNSLASEITKGFEDSDDIAKALDVSDYLSAQHQASVDALERLADSIEKSGGRQHEFNLVLAKSLIDQSKLVVETNTILKGIGERLGVLEQQPARPPKSKLNKSNVVERPMAGGPAEEDQMSKSDVRSVLSGWIKSGRETSDSGESLLLASSRFEQFSKLSPSLHAEVEQELASRKRAH